MDEQNEAGRMKQFGEAIDELRREIEAKVGAEDVAYIKRMRALSRRLELLGRGLIHVSVEPASFTAGVLALWLHKQLEATEIGHTALHGAFDGLPGAEGYQSKTFSWATPIDEESWRYGHNVRHHQYTNIAGRDPDIHFGPVRLTEHTPHRRFHYIQLPWLVLEASQFLFGMNLHFTGVVDAIGGNGRPEQLDFLPDRKPETVRAAWRRALRKFVPYYAKEYGFYPALAGPFFWKVAMGNWMAATIRDFYSAATIYCGHVGEHTQAFDEGTRAHGRGEWYRMQIEAANNFEVPRWVSVLCGALDRQIEHHLFPRLPTERLREIAPRVRELCREHGVEYRSASWGKTLAGVGKRLWQLSFPGPRDAQRSAMTSAASATSPSTGISTQPSTPSQARPSERPAPASQAVQMA